MPAARKVTRRPAAKKTTAVPPLNFRQRLTEFLTNKAMAEVATERNEGDKGKKNGLKHLLLAYVMEHGEVDPETGSRFIELDKPIDIDVTGTRFKGVKAERRGGTKSLNAARARELLEEKGLLDQVEEFQYVLRLDAEVADMFGEWLKETGLIEKVVSCDAVLIEDNLLALHHQKHKTGKQKGERLLSEEELDGLYDTPDPTWAFVPQK